jgi:uncharacterized membrane protein (DUF2068 family)
MSDSTKRIAPWEDVALRSIAIYKLIKAIIFIALGFGLIRLMHHDVAEFLRTYIIEPLHYNPDQRFFRGILEKASELTAHKIGLMSFAAFFSAAIFATEGIGLYLRKHWAEWVVVFSTGLPLPIEFWEIYHKLAWWKLGVVVGNLLIIVYLIHRLRLDAEIPPRPPEEKPPQGPSSISKPVASEVR